jgi:hypothetical protein
MRIDSRGCIDEGELHAIRAVTDQHSGASSGVIKTTTFIKRLTIVTALNLAVAPLIPCGAQSRVRRDTEIALTPEMRMIDSMLVKRARSILERWGSTFYAIAGYIPDTAGPPRIMEMGLNKSVERRIPTAYRDEYRSSLRNQQLYRPQARTLGIITDSIAGPLSEAVDGAAGSDLPRFAITELEDRRGKCLRVKRSYRFVQEPPGEWEMGTVVFGAPKITRCTWVDYWAP